MLMELVLADKAYACQSMKGIRPVRDRKNESYVSEALYAEKEYPEFCSGLTYLMKAPAAAKIHSFMSKPSRIFMHDVYLTGILRDNYNILMDDNGNDERFDIVSANGRFNMTSEWIKENHQWCTTGLNSTMPYTFVAISQDKIVRDMFCTWNKVRMLKFAVNSNARNAVDDSIWD